MSWGAPRRPKVSNRLGIPNSGEGSDGDIQIRQTNLGAKLYGKIGGRWKSTFLSGEDEIIGTSGTKIGMDSSGTFTVGEIQCTGKIRVGKADGSFSATDNINIGQEQSGIGTYNVAIGYKAGNALTSDSQLNVLVGYNAGLLIAGGSSINNTCIGSQSGDAIGNASYNTCLGYQSDSTSSNGIGVGYAARATGQYGIAIGNNITAATNDCVIGKSGAIITVDFDADGTWTQSSDVRRKRNIKDDVLGLSFINDLKTKTFQWKSAEEYPEEWHTWEDLKDEEGNLTGEKKYTDINTDVTMHGLIAQEVKEALDNADCNTFGGWKIRENGQQEIGKAAFVFPLIKAVQELSAKVDTMQEEINNLKAGE